MGCDPVQSDMDILAPSLGSISKLSQKSERIRQERDQTPCSFLPWLILRPQIRGQNIRPKRRRTSIEHHGIIFLRKEQTVT